MARPSMGEYLRAKRERRELTLKQVARLIDWNYLKVWRLENDKQDVTATEIQTLAIFYKVPAERLFRLAARRQTA